jgi:glutamine synthetase
MSGKLNLVEKEDVVKLVSQKSIKLLNLCHVPQDGRLKTLSFAVSDERKVEQVLEYGERVDGSSLFSYVNADESDIYIKPKLETAFLSPFSSAPALNVLCRYSDENGNPLEVAPESILERAEENLRSSTGMNLMALAELEFYVISKQGSEPFQSVADKHYQESEPFSKFEDLRNEVLITLTNIGIATKYGHGEVGRILKKDGTLMEQHEIELALQGLVGTAEAIAITKWVIRNTCARHGVSVSFSPKIALEHAGNGMHIHISGLRNGKNIIALPDARLSIDAKEIVGGILKLASSLAAFGNPTPVSYLRFLTYKETPMGICWGARNRSALIRIPLWWSFKKAEESDSSRRTFEFRSPDPLANAYLLLAGIAVAAEYGLKNHEESLRIVEDLKVEKTTKKRRRLKRLPRSCSESAANLKRDRKYYEAEHVFPKSVIDETLKKLRMYRDGDLRRKLKDEPQKAEKLIQSFLHYG